MSITHIEHLQFSCSQIDILGLVNKCTTLCFNCLNSVADSIVRITLVEKPEVAGFFLCIVYDYLACLKD